MPATKTQPPKSSPAPSSVFASFSTAVSFFQTQILQPFLSHITCSSLSCEWVPPNHPDHQIISTWCIQSSASSLGDTPKPASQPERGSACSSTQHPYLEACLSVWEAVWCWRHWRSQRTWFSHMNQAHPDKHMPDAACIELCLPHMFLVGKLEGVKILSPVISCDEQGVSPRSSW